MKCSGGCGKELGNDWIKDIPKAEQYCEECGYRLGLDKVSEY